MSMCAGEIYCEIYRDKKYCKTQEKMKERGRCECRHARYLCEVEPCAFWEYCGNKGREEIRAFRDLRSAGFLTEGGKA